MKNMSPEQMNAYAAMIKRLEEWAQTVAERDSLIWEAHRAEVSNSEIAARMKISRTTVIQVLGTEDEEG